MPGIYRLNTDMQEYLKDRVRGGPGPQDPGVFWLFSGPVAEHVVFWITRFPGGDEDVGVVGLFGFWGLPRPARTRRVYLHGFPEAP